MNSNGPIPVLQAIRQGIIGGGESHVISLVQNIDLTLFRPVVLSFTDGPMIKTLTDMGVKVYVIPTTKPFDVSVWKKVHALIKEENIQLVHAHGTRAASNVFRACQKADIPLVYTVHGWSFHDGQSFLVKKFRIASEQFITNKATVTVSVSKSNQDTGLKTLRNFSSVILRYGINKEKFNPNKTYPDIRKKLGIKPDVTLVGFIARMTYQKNPEGMVRAFAEVAKITDDIHLLMVGEGELKEKTIALAKELGLEKNITFTTFSQDVPSMLNACDIYCLPSFWEGLPIGLLEAMAMGKAIIASAVDGTVEVIENRKNGMLIDPRNIHQLSKAILELHFDNQLLSTIEQAAMETISESYVDDVMTREIETLYFKTLSLPVPQPKEHS